MTFHTGKRQIDKQKTKDPHKWSLIIDCSQVILYVDKAKQLWDSITLTLISKCFAFQRRVTMYQI